MKKYLGSLLISLLLTGCAFDIPSFSTSSLSESESKQQVSSSEVFVSETSSSISSSNEQSSYLSSSNESSLVSSKVSSSSSAVASSSSSSKSSSSIKSSSKEDEESKSNKLPNGYCKLSKPNNTTPEDIDNTIKTGNYNGYIAEFNGYLPSYWSGIAMNNKTSGDFYASGNYKFSSIGYGIQTPLFNSWKKIEVRLYIGEVHGNTKEKDPDEHVLDIYGYDENANLIKEQTLDQGKIDGDSEGKTIKFYVTSASEVAYLEFRMHAFPCDSKKCYSFGLSKIQLIGWQYD